MKVPWCFPALMAVLVCGVSRGVAAPTQADFSSLTEQAQRLEAGGQFAKAEALLADLIVRPELTEPGRRAIAFARERLQRIRKDYALTRDELFAKLKANVRDVTESEFERWLHEGRFDGRTLDGTQRYLEVSVSNLFFRYPELESRRQPPRDETSVQLALWENARAIQAAARSAGRPYVQPKRFNVHMTVRVKTSAVSAGQTVRAWLPVPRRLPFQDDLELIRTSPPSLALAPPESPARSVYFDQVVRGAEPVIFEEVYEYTAHGVWFDLDPAQWQPLGSGDAELRRFLGEAPHIVFSPEMVELSRRIAGDETNRVRQARGYYEWIARNIRYSFAPEYSTIPNLGEFCRSRGYGDCGQEAFLFMTLCRLSGIPARWQSGWNIFPGAETMHDWCEIYLVPWGWLPVDPYMGIYAERYATALTAEQRLQLKEFYFGGLSQYRMSANGDHNQPLTPAKRAFRSDDVDFQRGEVEAEGRNLYFDQFSYTLDWREISLRTGAP